MKKEPFTLRTQTLLLSVGIVLVALLLFGLFSAFQQATLTRGHLADKVQISASHLKGHPDVISALEREEVSPTLMHLVESFREENEFLYIVVMDLEQNRYTHPISERIGQRFVGGDADLALEGESYISEAVGSLGPSVRAFEPVYNRAGELIGAISVGISTDAIFDAENQAVLTSLIGASGSLLVGVVGAYFLSNRIKRRLHGLEPQQIARLVNEREAILEAAGEGIIAINETEKIIAVNGAALTFLKAANKEETIKNRDIKQVWPELELERVMNERKGSYDIVAQRGNMEAVITKVPIFYKDLCIGALATFREKNHLDDIMKRLSGVETYARSLRSETHEFMNKLHIISAMVETESYSELQDYIENLSIRYQQKKNRQLPDEISKLVSDKSLAQFLSRKTGMLEALGINILFQSGTPWPRLSSELIDAWITIIGNTMDNSAEASHDQDTYIIVTIKQVGGVLRYVIEDNGKGFTPEQPKRSTKSGDHGYGLENVQNQIARFNGTFDILSREGKGTIITVHIPVIQEGGTEE